MHHFDAISQKIFGGGTPDPHLREGVAPSPTLPLSALRASVKPSASLVTWCPPPGSGGSGSALNGRPPGRKDVISLPRNRAMCNRLQDACKSGSSADGRGGGFRLSRGDCWRSPGCPAVWPFSWCQRWFYSERFVFFLHQIRRGYWCSLNGLSSVYSGIAVFMHLFTAHLYIFHACFGIDWGRSSSVGRALDR